MIYILASAVGWLAGAELMSEYSTTTCRIAPCVRVACDYYVPLERASFAIIVLVVVFVATVRTYTHTDAHLNFECTLLNCLSYTYADLIFTDSHRANHARNSTHARVQLTVLGKQTTLVVGQRPMCVCMCVTYVYGPSFPDDRWGLLAKRRRRDYGGVESDSGRRRLR